MSKKKAQSRKNRIRGRYTESFRKAIQRLFQDIPVQKMTIHTVVNEAQKNLKTGPLLCEGIEILRVENRYLKDHEKRRRQHLAGVVIYWRYELNSDEQRTTLQKHEIKDLF